MAIKIEQHMATNFKRYNTSRSGTLDSIEVHSIGCAQNSIQPIFNNMNQSSPSGITHAIVSADTANLVWQILPDHNVAWADAGYGNQHSYTFEICESDYMKYTGGANYYVTDGAKFLADVQRGYSTAVLFTAYLCKKFGFNPTDKLANGLHRVYSHNEAREKGLASAHVDPTHLWLHSGSINKTMDNFRADVVKAMNGTEPIFEEPKYYRVGTAWENGKCVNQLGAYEILDNAKNNCPAGYKVFDNDGKQVYEVELKSATGGTTQASDFKGLTETQAAEKALLMAKEDYKTSKILPSVTTAQFILESGYCTTELSQKANNCFGMKCSLSGNTWNSVWDGVSKVNIRTPEEYQKGVITYINADFRKYPCIEDSVADHSCYLLGAMNGSKLRYDGLTNCKNYKDAITLIKNGGYATDSQYVSKICNIIERYNLARYDNVADSDTTSSDSDTTPVTPSQSDSSTNPVETPTETKTTQYRVQCGSYSILDNANRMVKKMKAKGFDALMKKYGTEYIAQAGVFNSKNNAEKLAARIKTKNLPVKIVEM